jgi:hypothetical protein
MMTKQDEKQRQLFMLHMRDLEQARHQLQNRHATPPMKEILERHWESSRATQRAVAKHEQEMRH